MNNINVRNNSTSDWLLFWIRKITNKQTTVLKLTLKADVNYSVTSVDVYNFISSLLNATLNTDTPGVVLDEEQPYSIKNTD